MINRIQTSLRYRIGGLVRPIRNISDRKRYRSLQKNGDDFSIISQNCIGTFMYHDLGLEYRSPTVNLFMPAESFIRFAERLDYYLSLDAETIFFDKTASEPYPVGMLDDVKIHFVHYNTEREAIDIWNRRRARINYDRMLFVMTDKDGCTSEITERFLSLPYKKRFFSSKKIEHPDVVYMPCFFLKMEVGGVTDYCNVLGKRYYEKYFDYIGWLTEV